MHKVCSGPVAPTVTVGIPFLNCEATLELAIKSVYAQTLENWELILVDDGSEDNSLNIARSLSDSRIVVLSDGHRRGLAARLNQICAVAKGRFLARMDGDDVMHPDRLRRQVEYLEQNHAISAVGSGLYIIDGDSSPWGVAGLSDLVVQPSRRTDVLDNPGFPHGCMMARTAWFRQNLYDESFLRAEDLDLWCRVLNNNTVARIGLPLYFYRVRKSVGLSQYIKSTVDRVRVALRYGPSQIGVPATAVACATSTLKALAVCGAITGGFARRIVERRFAAMSRGECEDARSLLEQIGRLELPRRACHLAETEARQYHANVDGSY